MKLSQPSTMLVAKVNRGMRSLKVEGRWKCPLMVGEVNVLRHMRVAGPWAGQAGGLPTFD